MTTTFKRLFVSLALTSTLLAAPALAATASTSAGQISVAQVMAMLERAGTDDRATQLLHAYLGGVGETAGVLVSATNAEGRAYVTCEQPMSLDRGVVRSVLRRGAPDEATWTEIAATPLIVSALISRAGCR